MFIHLKIECKITFKFIALNFNDMFPNIRSQKFLRALTTC